jgi:large subunit ribosomal protein L16
MVSYYLTMLNLKKKHKVKISVLLKKQANNLIYGFFGLKSLVGGVLTAKQLETARRVISRETNRIGRVFIRVFFSLQKTKKPLHSRMGKGSGVVKLWIAVVKKGSIILEMCYICSKISKIALKLARLKLPIKCILVERCLTSSNR